MFLSWIPPRNRLIVMSVLQNIAIYCNRGKRRGGCLAGWRIWGRNGKRKQGRKPLQARFVHARPHLPLTYSLLCYSINIVPFGVVYQYIYLPIYSHTSVDLHAQCLSFSIVLVAERNMWRRDPVLLALALVYFFSGTVHTFHFLSLSAKSGI